MLIGRGRARWGLGAVCGLLFAAGLVMSLFQPTRFVSGYFVFAALVLLELAALFVITIKSTGTPPPRRWLWSCWHIPPYSFCLWSSCH